MAKVGTDWLSRTLWELRRSAGITSQGEAAARIGTNQSRISRLETGRYAPTVDEARGLCRLYKAPADVRARIIQAAKDMESGQVRARVVLSRGGYGMQERVGRIEDDSAQVRVFQPVIFPGLIQCEDYARGVLGTLGMVSGAALARAVAERMHRQQAADGKEVTLLTAEGALWWQGVSPQVMAAQLDYAASRLDGMRFGVIPWTTAATVYPTHGFSVYDHRVVIVGLWAGTTFTRDERDVDDYLKLFGELESLAVFGGGARDLLATAAARYRSLS